MNLQAKMVEHMVSPGLINFDKYRAYRSEVREEDGPTRFVDGELIEKFLDCSPEDQELYIRGLTDDGRQVTVRDISDMVEDLKRLH
jgi:DNA damage-binding protein 1